MGILGSSETKGMTIYVLMLLKAENQKCFSRILVFEGHFF
ncbi:hypothetical protein HMPREF0623_0193 [Pediococcus acidilactici DSM 20284]|uniref:Uncharacterized protein n=1 Tax=Pediococcus acidilactici DSM 20284 TaxID=862514 RepID=E0NEY1_PEDAC|nr:hypothetical protein HMPREF0623_0193 [Pediococcus acidilactici DSM 20284]